MQKNAEVEYEIDISPVINFLKKHILKIFLAFLFILVGLSIFLITRPKEYRVVSYISLDPAPATIDLTNQASTSNINYGYIVNPKVAVRYINNSVSRFCNNDHKCRITAGLVRTDDYPIYVEVKSPDKDYALLVHKKVLDMLNQIPGLVRYKKDLLSVCQFNLENINNEIKQYKQTKTNKQYGEYLSVLSDLEKQKNRCLVILKSIDKYGFSFMVDPEVVNN